jgi:hypothetical protein
MFRIPISALTDTIILQPATPTGMGLVLDEDDPVTFRVSITRKTKWLAQNDGALLQDIVSIVCNSPIPVGSVIGLPDGELVEVKQLHEAKFGRVRAGYQMVCW